MANILKIFKTVLILTRRIPDFTNSTTSASPPSSLFEPLFMFKLPIRHYNIRQNKPQTVFVFSQQYTLWVVMGVCTPAAALLCVWIIILMHWNQASWHSQRQQRLPYLLPRCMNKQTPTVPPELPSPCFRAQKHGSCSSESPPDSSLSSIRVTRLLWEERGDNAHTDSG